LLNDISHKFGVGEVPKAEYVLGLIAAATDRGIITDIAVINRFKQAVAALDYDSVVRSLARAEMLSQPIPRFEHRAVGSKWMPLHKKLLEQTRHYSTERAHITRWIVTFLLIQDHQGMLPAHANVQGMAEDIVDDEDRAIEVYLALTSLTSSP